MNISKTLIDDMPEVQENAIQQLKEAEQPESTDSTSNAVSSPGLVDAMGRSFSPDLHLVDSDNNPKLTQRGLLRIKRGKGPPRQPAKTSTIGGIDEPGNAPLLSVNDAQVIATGQSAASLTFVVGMGAFGSDGSPTQAEKDQITYAYQTYFAAKGFQDLPPGVVLVTALATYVAPRLMLPAQQGKFKKLFAGLKRKFSKKNDPEPDAA